MPLTLVDNLMPNYSCLLHEQLVRCNCSEHINPRCKNVGFRMLGVTGSNPLEEKALLAVPVLSPNWCAQSVSTCVLYLFQLSINVTPLGIITED
ncbi:hypothetical protein ACFX2I_043199 [Malus domestica]